LLVALTDEINDDVDDDDDDDDDGYFLNLEWVESS